MFTLKKWNGICFWEYDIKVDTCAICRNLLVDLCLNCKTEDIKSIDCTVASGICNHAFHFHCISKWLKNRLVCPMCNSDWEYQTI